MIVREFDSDEVNNWIERAAQEVVNECDSDCKEFIIHEMVVNTCDRMISENRDYIMLMAYYVTIHEACIGECIDPDDSAYRRFENDVTERVYELLGGSIDG